MLDGATVVRLTDDQMETLHEKARTSETPSIDVLITAWPMIIGQEQWDALGPNELRVMDWAIPKEQWEQICQWLFDATDRVDRSGVQRVNYGLDWMNKGPSATDE